MAPQQQHRVELTIRVEGPSYLPDANWLTGVEHDQVQPTTDHRPNVNMVCGVGWGGGCLKEGGYQDLSLKCFFCCCCFYKKQFVFRLIIHYRL